MASPPKPDPERLDAETCAWLVRLQADQVSDETRQEFAAWLAQSPQHTQVWEALHGLWQRMDGLESGSIPGASPLPQETRRTHGLFKPRYFAYALVSMAAFAIVLLVAPSWQWGADYVTNTGEHRTVILADNSQAELDAQSAIALHYTGEVRHVDVLAGTVVFTVMHEPTRPFIVASGKGETRAVGTRFQVARDGENTTVAVLEGVVSVENQGKADNRRIGRGQLVRYGRASTIETLPSQEFAAVTAWRTGHLRFRDTPLRSVLAQLNRYRPGRILLVNPALADYRVSGLFQLSNPDSALQAITEITPAKTRFTSRYLVILG